MDRYELSRLFVLTRLELKYNFNIAFHPDYDTMKFDAYIDMRDFFYIKRNIARKMFPVQLDDEIKTEPLRNLSKILVQRGVIRKYCEERDFHDAWVTSKEPHWCGYGTPKFCMVYKYKRFPSIQIRYRETSYYARIEMGNGLLWNSFPIEVPLSSEQKEKLSIKKLQDREKYIIRYLTDRINTVNESCDYAERMLS